MTELQKRPKYGPSWGLNEFTREERDYYKARCAVAEEALKKIDEPHALCRTLARAALRIIAASEHP